jgi:hypothetical protein
MALSRAEWRRGFMSQPPVVGIMTLFKLIYLSEEMVHSRW